MIGYLLLLFSIGRPDQWQGYCGSISVFLTFKNRKNWLSAIRQFPDRSLVRGERTVLLARSHPWLRSPSELSDPSVQSHKQHGFRSARCRTNCLFFHPSPSIQGSRSMRITNGSRQARGSFCQTAPIFHPNPGRILCHKN